MVSVETQKLVQQMYDQAKGIAFRMFFLAFMTVAATSIFASQEAQESGAWIWAFGLLVSTAFGFTVSALLQVVASQSDMEISWGHFYIGGFVYSAYLNFSTSLVMFLPKYGVLSQGSTCVASFALAAVAWNVSRTLSINTFWGVLARDWNKAEEIEMRNRRLLRESYRGRKGRS